MFNYQTNMKTRFVYLFLITILLASCTTEDFLENENVDMSEEESDDKGCNNHSGQSCLVLNSVVGMPFETKAATLKFKKVGVVKRGGNNQNDKVHTYQYGKYSAPGVLNKTQKENVWMAASTNDVMALVGATTVAAFVPSGFMKSQKIDANGFVALKTQVYRESQNYDLDTNSDFCVHNGIPISKFNSTPLNLKHIFGLLDIEIKATQQFVDQNVDAILKNIKLEAGGLSHTRNYNLKEFKWGEAVLNTSYPFGTTRFSTKLIVSDFVSTKSFKIQIPPFVLTTDMVITLVIGTINYKFTIPRAKLPKIESNKRYVVNVSFQ